MTAAVLVNYDHEKKCKLITCVWGTGESTGPWRTWEGILCLLVKALSRPVAWLTEQWSVVGTVPGDEGIIVSVRIDPTIKARTIVIGIPPKPLEFNYVVGVQLATLLLRALAYPDDAYIGESVIGVLDIHGPDAVHHAAEDVCKSLPEIVIETTPSSPPAAA